jgi:hypothetical protein
LNKTGRFANHSYLLLYFYSMDPDRRNWNLWLDVLKLPSYSEGLPENNI